MGDLLARMEPSPGISPEESSNKATSSTSDVIGGGSKKRPMLDESDGEPMTEPATKRRRIVENGLQTPPAEDIVTAVVDPRPVFNDEPSHLVQRAIAVVLEHVGFHGASKEALESFCGEVDSYATKFLSYVRESMLSARRSSSTPPDFEYALRCEGLTAKLLKPHLKPPITASKINPVFAPVPQQGLVHRPAVRLIGEELSGDSDKRMKAYIPKQFPSFPSKHTYKSTDVKMDRETDPRKIREKATEEARHGEEALRRLVKVGKAGDHRGARKGTEKATKQDLRHEMWEAAMEDLATVKPPIKSSGGGDAEEQSIVVNAEAPYRRRPTVQRGGLA